MPKVYLTVGESCGHLAQLEEQWGGAQRGRRGDGAGDSRLRSEGGAGSLEEIDPQCLLLPCAEELSWMSGKCVTSVGDPELSAGSGEGRHPGWCGGPSGCKEAAACQRMVGTPIQQCCLEDPDSGLRGGSQGGSGQPGLHSKNQSQKKICLIFHLILGDRDFC